MNRDRSRALYEVAKGLMPGGVSSPVRSFQPYPTYIARGKGSRIIDVDGNDLIDYCMAYGPLILGHAHPKVVRAVQEQAADGTLYGAPIEKEIRLVERLARHYPSIEMARIVNSGTEATMHAIRLARGYTGRNKIVKFEGCFHGAHDAVLVKAGSGATTHSAPNSLGVPPEAVANTLLAPYNDLEAVRRLVADNKGQIAAVIVEPVMGNVGPVLPRDGYLQGLREVTEDNDVLLIFDEVITGFRLSLGGAQAYFGVTPDITTLGKIAGGGLPIGIFGASEEIMSMISPSGKVYQAGTFSGNPLSLAAGLATIDELSAETYEELERKGRMMRQGIAKIVEERELPYCVQGLGSLFQVFCAPHEVSDYQSALGSDQTAFMKLFHSLLDKGVYLPPSQFETCFLSTAHTDDDIARTLDSYDRSWSEIS